MKYRTTIQNLLWLLLIVSFAMTSGCASLVYRYGITPDARTKAVEKLTDPLLLAKIAVEDEHYRVRKTAVEKLTDQTLLAKIAVEDEHDWVRQAAVEKLTDQTLLAKIAVEDKNGSIRHAAVENRNLTDQSFLAEIAGEDSDPGICYKAINKVFDSSLLHTCKHREYGNIRNFAQLRLILRDPVTVKHTGRIEAYIIFWVTSESYKFDMFKSTYIAGENLTVYIENLTHGTEILRYNVSAKFPYVTRSTERISAGRIDANSILGELLENCNVTDPGLADIAINAKDRAVRRAAVEKLTDQPLLGKIAVEHEDDEVRRTAVKKLTDQTLLGKIAVEEKHDYVRRTAVEKLTDQPLLAKIAIEEKDERVRKAAKLRLSVIQGLAVD